MKMRTTFDFSKDWNNQEHYHHLHLLFFLNNSLHQVLWTLTQTEVVDVHTHGTILQLRVGKNYNIGKNGNYRKEMGV
jgi:ATP-dependent protease HslVU (ClpYQ) peptidase subunit